MNIVTARIAKAIAVEESEALKEGKAGEVPGEHAKECSIKEPIMSTDCSTKEMIKVIRSTQAEMPRSKAG